MLKKLLFLLLISTSALFAQQRQIKIINADKSIQDQEKYGEAIVSFGNILVEHEGATISCKKSILYPKKNFIEVFGDVVIKQGDTITQTSNFGNYDGNKKLASAWGNVIAKNQTMTLTTEKVYFDRVAQKLYYDTFGTIVDQTNTLTSNKGRYFLKPNKFQALSKVKVVNPDNTLITNHLDYYTKTGIANVLGPTTITGKDNVIYTEKGTHNTKTKISQLTQNAKITYKDRIIESDSLYQNDKTKFASATGNVKITDTINKGVAKAGYAEYYQLKDSIFLTKRAVVISEVEKDSMYIHGDRLLLTGKPEERIIRAYDKVKFFKSNLRGKCDSLYSSQITGLTKMHESPVLWMEDQQITGDTIQFVSNVKTEQLDSLKVLGNALIVKQDSVGYSQTKGRNIFGMFNNNKLDTLDVKGNSEIISYNRDEKNVLNGITKMVSSKIQVVLKDQRVQTIDFVDQPEGKTYPASKFPEELKLLNGFVWRESEKPLTPNDIFKHEPVVKPTGNVSSSSSTSDTQLPKKKRTDIKKLDLSNQGLNKKALPKR